MQDLDAILEVEGLSPEMPHHRSKPFAGPQCDVPRELSVEGLILDTVLCSEVRLWGAIGSRGPDFTVDHLIPPMGS